MSQSYSARLKYETLRELDWSAVAASYVTVGTSFDHPVRMLKISNFTDSNLLISFNGVDAHDIVAAKGAFVYDYGTNRSARASVLEQDEKEFVYIKAEGALPTTGKLYITVMYARDN